MPACFMYYQTVQAFASATKHSVELLKILKKKNAGALDSKAANAELTKEMRALRKDCMNIEKPYMSNVLCAFVYKQLWG